MSDRTLYREVEGTMPHERWPLMEALHRGVLVPVKPVGYINVRETGFISREQDIEPGRYALIPLEADDE